MCWFWFDGLLAPASAQNAGTYRTRDLLAPGASEAQIGRLSAGAALGRLVATHWGFAAVFIGSANGRLLVAVLFARFVHPLAATPQPASISQAGSR